MLPGRLLRIRGASAGIGGDDSGSVDFPHPVMIGVGNVQVAGAIHRNAIGVV